jgi:NADPH-dependent 2,4-dienoyl-CoA reductase/sulfur reductase-like enzyme/peroxiredoxin family protein/rhodanese-related sulfurtransferase/TusA-related sulfurtransferase
MAKRVLIIGGVAGGMSCATRIKRLDATAEVVVLERGPDVSFANCGMPYYVGGVIDDRANMLMQTPQGLRARYGLDIRVRHEALSIDRYAKQVVVKNLETGETRFEPYDVLVLSPGASPIRPPIPGADAPHVFVLNNLDDMDRIAEAASSKRRACVIGAGFIGLELVENLRKRGLEVSLVEMMDQVLPPFDREMTRSLSRELKLNGVSVHLGDSAVEIKSSSVVLKSGAEISCDFVCMCIGVRPNAELAKKAAVEVGSRGHIRVDAHMRTSDPNIYAVGDAVETRDFVLGERAAVPLAGPANRQGRIAADNICGRPSAYHDTQGTAIVRVFNLAAAVTGLNERRLKDADVPYRRAFIHPTQHAKYYPNSQPISVKLLFSSEGKILGAQIVGGEGVEPLINVLAVALRAGHTVRDLESYELAYSPQWGGAKHGINMLGFVASNILNGDVETIEPDDNPNSVFWLDVRNPAEAECGMLPGATLIPLDELRDRLSELPHDKEIAAYCAVGLRGYIACRILTQAGFKARNLNGGYRSWTWFQEEPEIQIPPSNGLSTASSQATPVAPTNPLLDPASVANTVKLDCCGMQCPGPLVKVKTVMSELAPGRILEVSASDSGFTADIPAWCVATGNHLLEVTAREGRYVARIEKAIDTPPHAGQPSANSSGKKTIVCFSGDLDRALATFIIANGAAAMGSEVTIFFTFWGLNILRKQDPPRIRKSLLDWMFSFMMPRGVGHLKLSKLNMAGIGTLMMKHVMRSKNVMTLEELVATAKLNGVRLIACSMSMEIMGIAREELIDGVEIAGVANYLGRADEAAVNLFI